MEWQKRRKLEVKKRDIEEKITTESLEKIKRKIEGTKQKRRQGIS